VSGLATQNASGVSFLSGTLDFVSGVTLTNANDITFVSGLSTFVSGVTLTNTTDITFVSGTTNFISGNYVSGSSSEGSGTSIVLPKVGNTLPFKSILGNGSVSISTSADTLFISGSAHADLTFLSGLIDNNISDITFVSGLTDTNTTNITFVSGLADTNTTNITFVSGTTNTNTTNITFVSGLATFLSGDYIPLSQKAAVNGVASLNASGKVPNSQIPAIAITETWVVDSAVAQTGLNASGAEIGDVAVRTDENKSYILAVSGTDSAETLSNWQLLLTPTDAVLSVNSQTGIVSLDTDDIPESATNFYFTSFVSGTIDQNTSDITFVSGLADTNITNISTNVTNITFVSGLTDTNTTDISFVSGLIGDNDGDIAFISGLADTNTTNITFVSGLADTNTTDISFVSGLTDTNATDISFISGGYVSGINNLLPGEGIADSITNRIIDFKGITGVGAVVVTSNSNSIVVSGTAHTDISFLSGLIDTNTTDITFVSGTTDTNASDISTNTTDIAFVSGNVDTNTANITFVSGNVNTNTTDISFISGNYVNGGNSLGETDVFVSKTGNILDFKGISGVGSVSVTSDGSNVFISGLSSNGEANTSSNSGAGQQLALPKVGVDLPFRTLLSAGSVEFISGLTTLTISGTSHTDITFVSGLATTNATDIAFVSGNVDTNTTNISFVSGLATTNATNIATNVTDITFVSGLATDATNDIAFVSGLATTNTTNIATNVTDISFVSGNYISSASSLGGDEDVFWAKAGNNLEFRGLSAAGSVVLISGATSLTISGTSHTDIGFISGLATDNATNITFVSGLAVDNQTDITFISGNVDTNTANITYVSGLAVTNQNDISFVSGLATDNTTDITFISGNYISNATNLTPGEGSFAQKNGNNLEFKGVTGVGSVTVTSSSNSIIVSGAAVSSTPADYVFAYDTTTQTVAVADTFQDITFNTNAFIEGWTHTAGGILFTGNTTSLYEASYSATVNRNGNPTSTLELIALKNGSEISGSQVPSTLTSNNARNEISNTFIMDITAGDDFKLQFTATNTNGQLSPVGANASITPSVRLTIRKL